MLWAQQRWIATRACDYGSIATVNAHNAALALREDANAVGL